MGGVVSRNIILNHMSSNLQNLKGVLFISSPLNGSKLQEEVENDLGTLISLYNSFTPFEEAITRDEFNQFFLDSLFARSKASSQIQKAEDFQKENEMFLSLNIPYFVYLESKKSLLPVLGRHYWTTKPEMGRLEKDRSMLREGKNHSMVCRIES